MILSPTDCEIHVQHNLPYTIEKPYPTGITILSPGYEWDYRSGQYYIKKTLALVKPDITIYYSDDAGWGDGKSCGDNILKVPYDADEDMVVGILCVLTGKVKYAKYLKNNPQDNCKADPYWDWDLIN